MFQLTLVDHLRMTFGHIVYQHRAHAQIAYSRARWNRGLKAFEVLLMIGASPSQRWERYSAEVMRTSSAAPSSPFSR